MTRSIPKSRETNYSAAPHLWETATWEDYLAVRDDPKTERMRIFFDRDRLLLIDMGWEGINHAPISDLFTMLFILWFSRQPEQQFSSLGRCLLEKAPHKAAAPDLVLYLGEEYPRWQVGEKRRIDLDLWRVPNLVGEIADTTLATDLDEKKRLYADLNIPEYWVVDVRGQRVIAFGLQDNGLYSECVASLALNGLPIILLEETIARLSTGTNGSAALWFSQQITNL